MTVELIYLQPEKANTSSREYSDENLEYQDSDTE